ncbi:MAG: S1C family serine protease [bacterium]
MDIKDLNKPQLLLLAVLLSFVTSIATGITTVTLMQQAPVSFTAPVNRIIKQTVEKIQQVEGKTVTQTVVVKEEDLVVDAIAKNQASVFNVTKEFLGIEGNTVKTPTGRGFVVSSDGVIVVDGTFVPDNTGNYFVKNDSGKFKAEFLFKSKDGFSFLKIGAAVNGTDKAVFTVPTFGDLAKMKAGQKILVFGNTIFSYIFEGNKTIDVSATRLNAGGMILNLDGEVLGVALSDENKNFALIGTIDAALKSPNGATI